VNGTLRVDVLTEGVHSGDAGGVVPSSFSIARQLLDRIDDSAAFTCDIPADRLAQAKEAAGVLRDTLWKRFPLTGRPLTDDPLELILNRTWRPALEVTGADGLPPPASAGNVHRPYTTLKLSLRLPPLVDGVSAAKSLKEILEREPPYSARIAFEGSGSSGWNGPATAPWLASALDAASSELWGKPTAYMGEGGTIPFMAMLNEKFPRAQLLVTGVLGPRSNAHGPNEFIDIGYAKRVTAAAAMVIASLP
jgi:acetylornithine deacetylase/succinyl-diaminopimelate desuccinylase-like protein